MLNKKPLFTADIIAIKHFFLKDINDYVAALDTGYSAEECRKMIQTMYKASNIDWNTRLLSLVLFRKNKNSADQYKETSQLQESA